MTEILVANKRIAAELFGEEIVLIDVGSGRYFSLRGAAADLWTLLAEPRLRATLADAFIAPDDDALQALISQMQEQHLVLATSGDEPPTPVAQFMEYRPGLLEIYTDLAELIALDPVHEVDAEQGWPVQQLGSAGA